MPAFTDRKDRTWHVELDVAMFDRIRREFALDFYRLGETKFAPLFALLDDPVRLVQVLATICDEQLQKANITPESFGAGFNGDALHAAAEALIGAIVDFFPRPQQREALRLLLGKTEQVAEKTIELAKLELAALDVEQLALTAIKSAKLPAASSNSSGNSPDSSASTPPG